MSNLGKKPTDDDEVEQLLRAAQDDVLLKLSVNSHMARASAAIDPDLDRRFLALKKPQKQTKKTDDSGKEAGGDDDLFTRFAALKSSIPSHSGKEKNINFPREEDNDEDEDEVEQVIKWAIDAARLDPSPPSDDDLDHSSDDDDDDDDEDRDGSEKEVKRK